MQAVDAGGRLFGQAADFLEQIGKAVMDHRGQVTAVVQDHVERLAVDEVKRLLDAPVELLFVHAFPGEDGNARRRDRGRGVILRRENIAARPADFGPQVGQRLDQHGRLDRHVEAAGNPRPLEGLAWAVLFAERHQAGHFVLGHLDLFATPFRERQIGDLVRQRGNSRHQHLQFGFGRRTFWSVRSTSVEAIATAEHGVTARNAALRTVAAPQHRNIGGPPHSSNLVDWVNGAF